MTRAYVGLGANLGDREATIRRAAALLGASRLSPIRETEPWGDPDQPNFLNAAAELETELTPRQLLDRLLEIERLLGRVRDGRRYGPRLIDLDLSSTATRWSRSRAWPSRTRTSPSASSRSSRFSTSIQGFPCLEKGAWRT